MATWHDCGRLETENTVCVPGRAVLASSSVVHGGKTGCNNGNCESRNGGCELLFGDGTVEHTLDS